ncbi:NlpC/P60 family protein [Enterococcus sp. CSURQ0835]|uniref:NlpC/P60 family protein n=1 Tax=Enterococcus sp. CSURQ0835 TaxID=2681394 RepID=UPI00135C2754|nr:NlpC/P60 family protein [Enterococcus sp. CSURQ0835]
MKLSSKKNLGALLLPCLLLALPAFAHADETTTITPAPTAVEQKSVNQDEELKKAKAAGYSEEQFKKIMEMPNVAGTTEIPVAKLAPQILQRTSSKQSQVVNEALKYLGVPYVWGGTTPAGFDCSGLMQYAYRATGINISRVTYTQEYEGTEVSLNALEPGDLLFYGARGSTHHVAMYIGNGQMIHAPQPGDVVKVIEMKYFMPSFARRIIDEPDAPAVPGVNPKAGPMHRLYNPNSGEHFYTSTDAERDNLTGQGWQLEGTAWTAPEAGAPVYRLYNPNAGDHHYTMNSNERDMLQKAGWNYEGISWYSDGDKTLLRVYNPQAKGAGAHHYTLSGGEKAALLAKGWKDEGSAWNGK